MGGTEEAGAGTEGAHDVYTQAGGTEGVNMSCIHKEVGLKVYTSCVNPIRS